MSVARKPKAGRYQQAQEDFEVRLREAIALFDAPTKPLWQRTVDGMLAFKGLNMDGLPPRLLQRIDRHFVAINRILEQYDLKTWNDYQHIPDDDLRRLQDNIRALAGKD